MRRILPNNLMRSTLIWLLTIMILVMGMRPPETAAMLAPALPTAGDSSSDSHRIADLQKLQRVLESKVVQQRLEDFGLAPEEVKSKLARLSDDQLHQFATEVDAIIPAGDGLGIVIALLVIAILIVILVYLLDHRIIVTKNGN